MADLSITVRLPEEKVRRLKQIAASERRTLTDVIEEGVDATLSDHSGPSQSNCERLSYAIGVCGVESDVTKMSLGEILGKRLDRDGHI